jgi:adenine-specific DNA-methyltransferase
MGPKFRPLYEPRPYSAEVMQVFSQVRMLDGSECPLSAVPDGDGNLIDYRTRPQQLFVDHPGARIFQADPLTSGGVRTNQSLPFSWGGNTFEPKAGNSWKHTARAPDGEASGMQRLAWADRLIAAESTWRYRRFFDDFPFTRINNWWDGLGGAPDPIYVVQTNTEIVKRCMLMTTDPGDLVLDPTCGSGTTAVVAEQWGRRWITTDTSRVALALARTRLMSSRYAYYLLADSRDGAAKESELSSQGPTVTTFGNDIKKGFVYKRALHQHRPRSRTTLTSVRG